MHLPPSTLEFAQRANGWAARRSPQAKALWAKSGDETGHLCLPQHLVDTACAAAAVYDVWVPRRMKEWLAGRLEIDEDDVRRIYLWLSGVHDIGKATVTFQSQSYKEEFEHLVSAVRDSGLPVEMNSDERSLTKFPHGEASGIILKKWLRKCGYDPGFSGVVDAHHGIPSSGDGANEERSLTRYKSPWKAVHAELLDEMANLTNAREALEHARGDNVKALQILTGLVVMADWIASNQDAFPMVVGESQEERLCRGMEATDLTGPWSPAKTDVGSDRVFERAFGFAPRPVQRAFFDAASHLKQPGLLILEAETGVGKTEGALAAAMAMGKGAQGIYFAAPTMATANGLLERVMKWAESSVEDDHVSSMYLAHSKNQLSESYQKLRYYGVGKDHGKQGHVVASSWMSGRRRGLLSNVVVGTIDQVLMMALKQRYSMLRHVALAGKVVIFDEVHAFDTYTSDYLMRTIRWLAYYGASVIVMTATLPPERRQALVAAYTEAELPDIPSDAYPLITVATQESVETISVDPAPTNLVAEIRYLSDELDDLTAELEDLLVDGGCALIICNTIARAQEAYRRIVSRYPNDTELHHAGFIAWQRAEKEDGLRAALGPDAHRGQGRPYRRIVVATQVAEQSLDIDADVLITDIAPIDLIIQRIGRVHRHRRPESDRPKRLQSPQVIVRAIVGRDPVPEFDSGAAAIYGTKLLLATFANLPQTFRRPDDIPGLVRTVYSADPRIPSAWARAWEEAVAEDDQRQVEAHSRAGTYMLPVPEEAKQFTALFGLTDQAMAFLDREEAGNAQVRDAEPSVEVIPIVAGESVYRPYGGGFKDFEDSEEPPYKEARQLAASTVRLPARMTRWDDDFDAVVGGLEQITPIGWQQSNLLKGQLALPLDQHGEITIGRFTVRYTDELGIEIVSDGRGSDV
ncbi:CRISPR-associated helicase Cas3' [Corynebacterium sanguinis]|uniref:CRISPR-associated helicase Cas3' n=1 Tax=Corynebacterium sanguinis TaxID=2594913 RepID=UPI0021B04A15|nr:CRISPR-associated helicase Cas3' [Corynebacterium sanguinis]MCT1585305.1 CRISPR-associated helicase Cas3' [Corynebacterium sanguinis]MCT2023279.1 CRISPR-associated helicase Cas3' [Corynebacterium sanguinis]MCT2046984.1 CRISPR-associated helicase Cas3' [Corynebacterium sanguinis]MCT2159445.1 CRISPR-associated helicase Cas3' [Corynebacterium sanguinis]